MATPTSYYISKPQVVEAKQLTVDNLEELETWSGGSIKGIKLPKKDQVIEVWDNFTGCELRAGIGDYLVFNQDLNQWSVYTDKQFERLFRAYI